MKWEKTESKRAQGQAGRPRSVAGQPHFAPLEILGFFPKFPYKSLNSLLPLIWIFGKKILKKGNPNLGTTMLFK
jgi:hypothetical protein